MHGEHLRSSFAISTMVSVVADKAGGDSVHTIRSRVGMANSFDVLRFFVKGTASSIAPLGAR